MKSFLRQKIFVFFTILYTAVFIVVNVVFFFTNNAYISDTISRENTSLVEMTEHLITYTGEENALVFLEHYGHTHSVQLTYETLTGDTEFETATAPVNSREYTVEIDGEAYARLLVDNDQSELVSKNNSYLLIFNGVLIGIYVLGLWLFSTYFKKQYGVIIDDMNKIRYKLGNLDEEYHYTFEEIDTISSKFDEKISQIHDLQKTHKKHIQSLAHDIKTPLTILRSTLEAVDEKRIALNGEVTDSLLEEIGAIDALIPRLIESTKEHPKETIDLSLEVAKACRRQESLFEDSGIQMHFSLDEDYTLLIERETVHRVVDHLLSNVRMHAKDGSMVKVKVDKSKGTLEVEDDGVGISDEAINKVYSEAGAATSSEKGSGLGLAIVKRMIENLGGSLEIEAMKPRGTKVTIFLSS